MGFDAVISILSVFGPKLIDFAKIFLSKKNTPAETLASLAQSNPDALAKYVSAQAQLIAAENASVNADVAGQVWVWVDSVRALIRPSITILGAVHIILAWHAKTPVPAEAMYLYETAIGSWFGSRLCKL